MKRRGNGEGSIYLRKDGTWCGSVTTNDGRRRVLYGHTREEVRQKLTAALQARETGTLADARGMTVGGYLDRWLTDIVKPSVRSWTYVGYEVMVRLHIKPTVGKVRLERLTPAHVQSLLNARLAAGLSPKYVRMIRGTLRTSLNQAQRWGLVSRNVASLVDSPKVERHDFRPFTPDEARAFLTAVRGDRLEALYTVALTLGLRQGEALGLRWQDVDLEHQVLRVEKQLQRIDRRFVLVELKTKRSRRTLAMPAALTVALGEHRRRQAEEREAAGSDWQEHGLVFTTSVGAPLEASTVLRLYHRHLDAAHLPQRRFHDLRHSCATLLMVQGVAPRVVMEILGHTDIGMTMNTYTHVIPELARQAADRMDELLRDER